mmetsp:Transcript_67531/g.185164  ORF Transcript_67531/g.185164 Transcript_67531/m.185164 type:complete len:85 (+) Transcript_67531:37-291(+)
MPASTETGIVRLDISGRVVNVVTAATRSCTSTGTTGDVTSATRSLLALLLCSPRWCFCCSVLPLLVLHRRRGQIRDSALLCFED